MISKKESHHNEEDIKETDILEDEMNISEKNDGELAMEPESEDGEEKTSDEMEEEVESDDERYIRLSADFQNFKRRVQKEKNDIYNYANEKIALDIIDVMDNFERALFHGSESEDPKFVEGIELIYKQLKGVLDKNNILEIESDGAAFDPNFHNAVMVEKNDDYESNIVIQTMQKGYTLNGKVIRPSMVKVSQ